MNIEQLIEVQMIRYLLQETGNLPKITIFVPG